MYPVSPPFLDLSLFGSCLRSGPSEYSNYFMLLDTGDGPDPADHGGQQKSIAYYQPKNVALDQTGVVVSLFEFLTSLPVISIYF